MPKIRLFTVSGYCCATATTAPTYSLNNVCAGPANLSASTSPLDVRSRRSRSWPVCHVSGADDGPIQIQWMRREDEEPKQIEGKIIEIEAHDPDKPSEE